MSIIANKVPGVNAFPCQDVKTAFDSRGINNSNVLTLGSMVTNNDNAKEIIEKQDFLKNSMKEIPKLISNHSHIPYSTQALKRHVNASDNNDDSIERLRFPKGSMEPSHHHTHGHDVFVIRGHKTVKNLTTGIDYDLRPGGYLYTPASQIHQVFYHEVIEYWFMRDSD
ncbi:5669_t:CDS:2, partial [Rhizophagus irregularis]